MDGVTFTSPSLGILPVMEWFNQIHPDKFESMFHIEFTDAVFEEIEKEYYQRHKVDVNEYFKQIFNNKIRRN